MLGRIILSKDKIKIVLAILALVFIILMVFLTIQIRSSNIDSSPIKTTTSSSTTSIEGQNISTTEVSSMVDNNNSTIISETEGSRSETTKSNNKEENNNEKYYDLSKYNLEAYMTPVWSGNIVYHESVMFYPNALTKELEAAPLYYSPEKIISLRSNDLKTEYIEGKDYVVVNGKIRLAKNTDIFSYDYDELYLTVPSSVKIGNILIPGRYVKFSNPRDYQETQFAVTYTHKGKWTGTVPKYSESTLKNTIKKLESKSSLNIVIYGSSSMTGCDASGQGGYEPNMPIFTNMMVDQLKKTYKYSDILEINSALGGTETKWGLENIRKLVTDKNPDLVIIGFGLNDVGISTTLEEYEQRTRAMIADVRSKNPNAEFILISTALPNPESGWTGLTPQYKKGLENIVSDTWGTVIAPMTDMHTELLTKKRYYDMTGNGVNHPNDFLARVYAQTVTQLLVKEMK